MSVGSPSRDPGEKLSRVPSGGKYGGSVRADIGTAESGTWPGVSGDGRCNLLDGLPIVSSSSHANFTVSVSAPGPAMALLGRDGALRLISGDLQLRCLMGSIVGCCLDKVNTMCRVGLEVWC